MFLGGLPVPNSDSGKAWLDFIQMSHKRYIKKLVIVVHPIRPTDEIDGYWKNYLNTGKKEQKGKIKCVFLNDRDTHFKTKWATRSLVDVTIMMIKESYDRYNTIKKFILVDKTTCPLYPLQTIYDTVMKNRKNWLDPLGSHSCPDVEKTHPNMFCKNKICLKRKDCSFWSQWLILDAKYIRPLLLTRMTKDDELVECGNSTINQIEVSNKQNNNNARIMEQSLIEMLDVNQKPCNYADELYFGLFLKRNKTIKEFNNTIQSRTKFSKTYRDITHIDDVKDVNVVDKVSIFRTSIESDGQSGHRLKYTRDTKSYPFYLAPINFNDRIVRNTYTVSSVYTNWEHFNLNPFNIFRSLEYKGLSMTKMLDSKTLRKTINMLTKQKKSVVTFESLKMIDVPYWAHPLEYNTIPLYKFINGYNMLEYFSVRSNDDYHLNFFKQLYKEKVLIHIKSIKYEESGPFRFIVDVSTPNKLTGYMITNDDINHARLRGSLFVRKCENGSFIHNFSKQLFKEQPEYIY